MAPAAIPLGSFDLIRPLGRGGMAEIWEGVHRVHETPVAIKVLTGDRARTPAFRNAFRNEARAAAGLDHPNILRIYDHGEISPRVSRLTDGSLRTGDPYLVMELATGGSLARLAGQIDWRTTRRILLHVLDALAHAHARGVVHRDLKPDNVLLVVARSSAEAFLDEDSLLGIELGGEQRRVEGAEVKLSDFGLSVALDQGPDLEAGGGAAGTPAYMAPEQVEGRWRDYGPWTDLYGLGCLAWALITGAAPFAGLPIMEQIDAHRRRAPPPLTPSAACVPPRGLEDWIRTLLQKDPGRRYRWAADARHALVALNGGGDDERSSAFPFLVELPTVDSRVGATVQLSEVSLARVTWAELEQPEDDEQIEDWLSGTALWSASRPTVPPISASWRVGTSSGSGRLRGAGLGLFRLRAPTMVGRQEERDLLWTALRQVHSGEGTRVVLLEGPTGIGKSRLARWLCEIAHEVGAAQTFHASFSPDGGGALEGLIDARLRFRGLSRPEIQHRLDALLRAQGEQAPDEAAALTELVCPATAADRAAGARVVRFEGPAERVALVQRFLARMSAERPVVVWLDDAVHSPEALLLASTSLRDPALSALPILLVLTSDQEDAGAREGDAPLLAELDESPAFLRLHLAPLPPTEHRALIRDLLGLEDELVASVADRTAGNPLFAVQLLQAWADRGWLAAGKDGYRLRSGARPDLPDSLYKVGESRLNTLLEGRLAADGLALELAATLGHVVDGAIWADAAEAVGARPPLDLVEQLIRDGLAAPIEGDTLGGFRFLQGVLRESLLRRASEAGRLVEHHRICARVLAAQTDPGGALAERGARALRLGRHHRAAGEPLLAIEPMITGVRGQLLTGDLARARVTLREWEEAAMSGGLPPRDVRWGDGWLLLGEVCVREGRSEEGRAWFEHAMQSGRTFGWSEVLARALVGAAWADLELGRLDEAGQLLEEAATLCGRLDIPSLSAERARFEARWRLWRGEHDEATRVARGALAIYEAEGDHLGAGHVLALLSDCANWSDELDLGVRCAEAAMSEYQACGYRWGMAFCANSLGEIARSRGRLDEALARYRASLALYRAIGAGQAVVPYVNIALTLMESGETTRARPILESGMSVSDERGHRMLGASLRLALLVCLAAARDWERFDQRLGEAETLLAETGSVDVDNARVTARAGRLAQSAGELRRARRVLQVSLRQWEALGRADEAQEVRAALAGIGGAED